jgi:hypothetical protein
MIYGGDMVADISVAPAPTSPSPLPVENRKRGRHACGPEITCRLLAEPTLDFWADRILNMSAGGISLVLDRLIPTGKVLKLELHHAARQFSCERQIRIIYTFKAPTGEITVGGAFSSELTDQDLQSLL